MKFNMENTFRSENLRLRGMMQAKEMKKNKQTVARGQKDAWGEMRRIQIGKQRILRASHCRETRSEGCKMETRSGKRTRPTTEGLSGAGTVRRKEKPTGESEGRDCADVHPVWWRRKAERVAKTKQGAQGQIMPCN